MYRIVKRIVRTITTVTLLVHWEDPLEQQTMEEEITLPASDSLIEEEVTDAKYTSEEVHPSSNSTLDTGEKP